MLTTESLVRKTSGKGAQYGRKEVFILSNYERFSYKGCLCILRRTDGLLNGYIGFKPDITKGIDAKTLLDRVDWVGGPLSVLYDATRNELEERDFSAYRVYRYVFSFADTTINCQELRGILCTTVDSVLKTLKND
jgi:hypothetical protein